MARRNLAGIVKGSRDVPIGRIKDGKVYPFRVGRPSKVPTYYVKDGKVYPIIIGGPLNRPFGDRWAKKPAPVGRVGPDGKAYLDRY